MPPVETDDIYNIARNYFKDILYIDDALKRPDDIKGLLLHPNSEVSVGVEKEIEQIEGQISSRPVTFKRNHERKEADETQNSAFPVIENRAQQLNEYFEAFDLVYNLNKLGYKVSPYYYENKTNLEELSLIIERSHLTIMDWELDESKGNTTLQLLDLLFKKSNKMKLFIIYTKDPAVARKSIVDKFNSDVQEMFVDIKDKEVYGFQTTNSLIIICKKRELEAEQILNVFIDKLVNLFGFFPFVFFDTINKITEKSAQILKKFSFPFDNALMLQLHSSGLDMEDYSEVVSRMVNNHITQSIDVNNKIFIKISDGWKTNAKKLLEQNDEVIANKVSDAINELIRIQDSKKTGIKNKSYIELALHVNPKKWREYFEVLSQADLTKQNVLVNVCEIIYADILSIMAELHYKEMGINGLPEAADLQVKDTMLSLLRENLHTEATKWLKPIIPSVILFIIGDEADSKKVNDSVNELVHLMKITSYDNTSIKEIEHFSTDETKINNYFNTGDILFKGDGELLLCISPQCDVFRPKKVGFKLKFIKGKIERYDSARTLGGNEHLSIIPDPEDRAKLICVIWKLSDSNTVKIKDLKDYTRPYRLMNNYIQQIVNSYIAYHSRAGVDEVFIKGSTSLRGLYIFNKIE
ncbi:response regulator receiver domain [Paenibacillus sp. SAF-054]|uniref:response regulator receiver domain n=1 Tax=unclassified Paenibacillus TaxID=185978 RepID=UPI003F7E323A